MSAPDTVLGPEPVLPAPLSKWPWLVLPEPVERAAALRIITAICVLFDIFVLYLPNFETLYGKGGFGDPALFDAMFSRPYWRWSLLRIMSPGWLAGIWIAATVALLVGFRPRLAALIGWMCALSFMNGNLFAHNGGDRLKVFLLLMLTFLPSDGRWAIRLHPAARTATGRVCIYPWPLRLMMIQLVIIYFLNGYYKILGEQWRRGDVMIDVAGNSSWAHFSPDFMPLPMFCFRLLAWGTLVWELGFPILAFLPNTRRPTLWIGAIFHVMTLIHLEVALFPIYSLCFYVPLLPWERWYPRRT